MLRPRLSAAITWAKFESAVLEVFGVALNDLALLPNLPSAEEPINLQLYWIARKAHHEALNSPSASIPFSIMADTTNQPEPDDSARSKRMKKRPDFSCVLNNPLEVDFRKSQVIYNLECKRLGDSEGTWILNENYAEHGMLRFTHVNWQYAKGCVSATMIGYLQNMAPDDVLNEVNANATRRALPSLQRAATSWAALGVTQLDQPALNRTFAAGQIELRHLWVDLRHCQFTIVSNAPPRIPIASPSVARTKPKVISTNKGTSKAAKAPKASTRTPIKKNG
jgi:hypothetical protein